jgi:hypothetical protein
MAQAVETAEAQLKAETNDAQVETVEAVIISGPRRGEIVRLSGDEIKDDLSDEEAKLLNEALDQLDAALERLSRQVRIATESIQKQVEKM